MISENISYGINRYQASQILGSRFLIHSNCSHDQHIFTPSGSLKKATRFWGRKLILKKELMHGGNWIGAIQESHGRHHRITSSNFSFSMAGAIPYPRACNIREKYRTAQMCTYVIVCKSSRNCLSRKAQKKGIFADIIRNIVFSPLVDIL